jgi:hypothetical protein
MKGQISDFPITVFPNGHNLDLLDHELGNVLNGLFGMAELLGDSGLTVEQNRWLRAIEHSGRQMQSLIRTVKVSGSSIGLVSEPEKVRVDGLDMLEQVLTSHTPAARRSRNHLLLVIDPQLPRYWNCDPCLVRQLLDNLVGNAIKFTRGGEVVVEVSAGCGPSSDAPLQFCVSDTGRGLDAELESRIYGAYQRARASGESEPMGRGLGLFICHTLVMSMDGRISCSSPAGGGALFKVILPGTLATQGAGPTLPHSSLFAQMHCQLMLTGELLRSVENFLGRLGVSFGRGSSRPGNHALVLAVTAPEKRSGSSSRGLLRVSDMCADPQVHSRVLHTPLLQSSLAAMLLETALEWRRAGLRSDKPDSAPRPY